jgi:hypothetical protein
VIDAKTHAIHVRTCTGAGPWTSFGPTPLPSSSSSSSSTTPNVASAPSTATTSNPSYVQFGPNGEVVAFRENGVMFYADLDRDAAEKLLAPMPRGFYVMRPSTQRFCLSLSYVRSPGNVCHLLVDRSAQGEWKTHGVPLTFPLLKSLLERLPYGLYVGVDLSFMTQSHWRPHMTAQEAEVALRFTGADHEGNDYCEAREM